MCGGEQYFALELTKLNGNLFIAEKIANFPFDLFVGPMTATFFSFAFWNAVELSVLQIVKLATDDGGDKLTLPMFKNRIHQSYIKPEHLSEFSS